MNKLIINTVLPQLQVVLSCKDKLYYKVLDADKNHNEKLLPVIYEVLQDANLQPKDIDECFAFIGPGSFTGIRVGVATVKGIADALGIKAYGINTLKYLQKLALQHNASAQVFALFGSLDSYFVAHTEGGKFVIEQTNLTKQQLLTVANGRTIYTFANTKGEDDFVRLELDCELLAKMIENVDYENSLQPVYFQLSQAEAQKISKNVDIVEGTKEDASWLATADKECFADNWSETSFQEEMSNGLHKVYIAKLLDDNIGYIDLLIAPDELAIEKIAVLPQYRRNNVATQLINRAVKYAKENGLEALSLEVSENNVSAKSMYEKFGFVVRRVRKNYYVDKSNAIEMVYKV